MMNFLFPVEGYFQIFLNHLAHLALDFKDSFSFFCIWWTCYPLNMELISFITCHSFADRSLYIVQYKNVRVCVSDQMIFYFI